MVKDCIGSFCYVPEEVMWARTKAMAIGLARSLICVIVKIRVMVSHFGLIAVLKSIRPWHLE